MKLPELTDELVDEFYCGEPLVSFDEATNGYAWSDAAVKFATLVMDANRETKNEQQ